ncbi:MAG TPA: hypothetical protein VFQ53_08785 [Kofleriaceae bacterium]|nr:hypothetical protein [Kofleriaceae bacterium]
MVALGLVVGVARAHADTPAQAPQEFIEQAKQLLVVGACADGTPAKVSQKIVTAHCKKVKAAQDEYKKSWITVAREFFATAVPTDIPKTVVYPFAGGDLSTALTVFPDAEEITTLSLEPAGDARAIDKLSEAQIKASLGTVATELSSLYKATFSRTMAMIGAMREGQLPTQLIFSLSALWLHGYEPTSLRYFQLTDQGDIRYLTAADFDRIDQIKDTTKRNKELANVELKFRKKGATKEQTYRHIMANLDDAHLKKEPAALRHIEKKGQVSAMTKAASFLLSFDDFQTMRKYLAEHVEWMVSDASGLAPKWGKPAGFQYETYGTFERSEMDAGAPISPSWVAEFKAQPKRPLKFRFGYPDVNFHHNLIIMRRSKKA